MWLNPSSHGSEVTKHLEVPEDLMYREILGGSTEFSRSMADSGHVDKPSWKPNTESSTGVHQPKGVLKTQTLPPNCHSNKGNHEPLNFRVSRFQSNPRFRNISIHQPSTQEHPIEPRNAALSAFGFLCHRFFGNCLVLGAIWLSILLVKIWDEI